MKICGALSLDGALKDNVTLKAGGILKADGTLKTGGVATLTFCCKIGAAVATPILLIYVWLLDETLFLEGAERRSGDVDFDFLTVDDEGLFLDVRLEDFAGLALRERNVVTVHLALATDCADCHYLVSFTVLTIALKASG